jgi:hypothetical protein
VFVAVESFVHGRSTFIPAGYRTHNPVGPAGYWVRDDGTSDTLAQAKQQLEEDREQAAANRRLQKSPEERLAEPNRTVRCTKAFVDVNYRVEKGERFPASHLVVALHPENFIEENA